MYLYEFKEHFGWLLDVSETECCYDKICFELINLKTKKVLLDEFSGDEKNFWDVEKFDELEIIGWKINYLDKESLYLIKVFVELEEK